MTRTNATLDATLQPILADLLLAVADDKLMLGHRNSDWTGLGPMLEEDIAFSSIAQDEIAHAQALYEFAGAMLGRTADQLAFGRPVEAYRCATIVEGSDGFDWSMAICRQFFCDHFDRLRLDRLARSNHPSLAALAARLAAEEQVHVDHVDGWIRRLGCGTEDSRQRVQLALDALGPLAGMMPEPIDGQERLEAAGVYPLGAKPIFDAWHDAMKAVTDEAGLELTLDPPPADAIGGRRGRHSAELATLLDEMCEVFRVEPEAAW